MLTARYSAASNRLLGGLPPRRRDRFLAECTLVDLVLGRILYERGDLIRHVYFPVDSSVSMLAVIDRDRTALEVGMVGSEGMCGHALVLGSDVAPLRALVQGAGTSWRMKASTFRRQLENVPALRQLLWRYVGVLFGQLAQAAACTRFHVVEQRLARWLLMTQDRSHADSFEVTQEFLAFMLGIRRVGVTIAAGSLQSKRLIRYRRGRIVILNRDRLEAAACSCYRADLQIYQDGLGARSKLQRVPLARAAKERTL